MAAMVETLKHALMITSFVFAMMLVIEYVNVLSRGSWQRRLARTLYAQGAIPMSILLANSIVQDGHGMLPLLADSRREFVVIKAINLAVGLSVGGVALAVGL